MGFLFIVLSRLIDSRKTSASADSLYFKASKLLKTVPQVSHANKFCVQDADLFTD